jgi:carboxylate-amine ligase
LIDFGKQEEVPVRQLISELIEFVDDVVDDLNCREEINHIHEMMERGTSADQQLRIHRETGDLKAVVDFLIEETMRGID